MESQTLFKLPEFLPAVRSPGGKLGHIIPPLGSASAPDTLCKRQCTRIKRILFQHPPLTAQVSVAPHGHDGPQRLIIPLRHLAGLLEKHLVHAGLGIRPVNVKPLLSMRFIFLSILAPASFSPQHINTESLSCGPPGDHTTTSLPFPRICSAIRGIKSFMEMCASSDPMWKTSRETGKRPRPRHPSIWKHPSPSACRSSWPWQRLAVSRHVNLRNHLDIQPGAIIRQILN